MIVLKDFEVKNFRSCALTRTQFDTQLTALVGINGSGKTNFLNAILLLKGILQPKFNAFFMRHNDLPEDHSSLTAKFDIDGKNIGLKADIWFDAREGRDSIVYSDTKMRNLDIKYSRWEQTLITPALRPFHTPSRSDGLLWNFKAPPKDSSATRYSREIKEFLSQIQYYSATQFSDPTRSPLSFEIDDTRPIETLKRSGVHERFLYDVYSQYQENKSDYKRYVDIVGQKGLGLIDEFVFGSYNMTNGSIRVQSGGMVQKVEKVREWVVPSIVIDGLQLSANQLSEGTFKTLALVFYILRSETSVLLVEEPEVCIHHGLLDSLIELLIIQSKVKQIVISTHSDYVLDKLIPENVQIVSKSTEGTVIRPVSKSMSRRDFLALKHYLKESGNLGEFWKESGLIGG